MRAKGYAATRRPCSRQASERRSARAWVLLIAREKGAGGKQVQEWLGHADPGFTLRTYVDLIDKGLADADFLDAAVEAAIRLGP